MTKFERTLHIFSYGEKGQLFFLISYLVKTRKINIQEVVLGVKA